MNVRRGSVAALLAVGAIFFLTAESCSDEAPAADSDSSQTYKDDAKIPVDDAVYDISGEVVADVNETTRQVAPAQGQVFGYNGYVSGSYFGPIEAGKGFVRLRVRTVNPTTDLARVSEVTIIKTSDTKAKALLPGDIVKFRCRRQYEAIAAVRDNSSFDQNKLGTWELDYCRLATPVIEVK